MPVLLNFPLEVTFLKSTFFKKLIKRLQTMWKYLETMWERLTTIWKRMGMM
jgi:hypothetical protein